ncbi:hypothetical protein [Amycolatopsis sp. lyj-90]|uniref:hypothetical protein n=1 Tax=Amycolatopsis sp. lyj-90 TaxID=2789285 RepID=UPI00397D0CF8
MTAKAMILGYGATTLGLALVVLTVHVGSWMILQDGLARFGARIFHGEEFYDTSRVREKITRVAWLGFGIIIALALAEIVAFGFASLSWRVTLTLPLFLGILVAPVVYVFVYLFSVSWMFGRIRSRMDKESVTVPGVEDTEGLIREFAVSRTRDRGLSLSLIFGAVLPAMWAGVVFSIGVFPAGGRTGPEASMLGLSALLSGVAALLWIALVRWFLRISSPHQGLIDDSFFILNFLAKQRPDASYRRPPHLPWSFRASRPRNLMHEMGFGLARHVERYVRGTERRLTPYDYERLRSTYQAIAWALRSESIGAARNAENTQRYRELVIAGLTLVSVEEFNLLPDRYASLVADVPEQPVIRPRWQRWVETADTVLQRGRAFISVLILLAGILFFLATGRLVELLGLVK